MDWGQIIAGVAVAALVSTGALAFRNARKWPTFKSVAAYALVSLFGISGFMWLGMFMVLLFKPHHVDMLYISFFVAAGSSALLLVLELAHWLREPDE